MKFRTKLIIILCLMLLVVLGIAGALITRSFTERVTGEFGNKLASIAATAAVSIDAEKHTRVAREGSKGDADYRDLRALLFKIKRDNQSQGVYDIYTLVRTEKPDIWMFIIDVDESSSAADFREEYDASPYPEIDQAINGPVAEKTVGRDKFGNWLSAYAPIHDENGRTVGIVGIDATADSIYQLKEQIVVKVLMVMAIGLLAAIPISWVASGMIEKPVRKLVEATAEVENGNFDYRVDVSSVREFQTLANAFNHMVAGLKERDFIKNTFTRYVSREVVDKIIDVSADELLKGERRNVTVLFTDLRRFTDVAETMRAEEVLEVLNQHFSLLIDALFEHEGTLDKFTGDGLMAIFGTPMMHSNDPERAVRAAIEMQERMKDYNITRAAAGLQPLMIGIGINSGAVVAGGVGSNRRLEYTVIGDTVNAAARIQGLAEGGQVIITQSTYDFVKDIVTVTPKGPVKLKGKKDPVNLYIVEEIRGKRQG